MQAVIAGEWWDDPKHQLSRYATRVCECPYHEKLRDDDEADRRDNLEVDDENNKGT